MSDRRPTRIAAALMAAVVLCAAPMIAEAGNCFAVNTVGHHAVQAQVLTIPVQTVQNVQTLNTGHCAAVNTLGGCNAVQNVRLQQLGVHAQQFVVQQVPVVQHQAVVLQSHQAFTQNACVVSRGFRQRNLVVEQRVRRERRGLGRLLFGR